MYSRRSGLETYRDRYRQKKKTSKAIPTGINDDTSPTLPASITRQRSELIDYSQFLKVGSTTEHPYSMYYWCWALHA